MTSSPSSTSDAVYDTASALRLFDSLATLRPAELRGRWRGRELPTGHPLDGILAASGWYGKQFDHDDAVHPLLFRSARGKVYAAEPRMMPMRLAARLPVAAVRAAGRILAFAPPVARARRHRARLRDIVFRGATSAAMVYDHLPIIDHFRRLDGATLLGLMDQRGVDQPYFFTLARDVAMPAHETEGPVTW